MIVTELGTELRDIFYHSGTHEKKTFVSGVESKIWIGFGLNLLLLGYCYHIISVSQIGPGACFSKVPRTFRARKASCETAFRFF